MKAIMRDAAELKDSGIGYLGYIPQNWQLASAKFFVSISNGSDPKTDGETPVYGSGKGSFRTCGESKDGPTVLLGRKGTVDIPQYIEGKYWNVDTAFDVKAKYGYSLRFFYYLSTCFDYKRYSTQTALPSMTQSNYNSMRIVVPSFSEQNSIYEYLDDRCSKIDAIIAEAKASIEEYKELKQAVIYEAVTKGLDKNGKMYKTNNIWIPLLPENIRLSRLGLHYEVILGKMLCPKSRNDEDSLEPYICAANVHFDGISGELKSMWFNDAEKSQYAVHCKDMLIVEGGAGAGGAAIVEEEPSTETYIQNSIMIVRAKDSKDNRYARYLVEALVKRDYVDFVCNKATIPHFTKEKVSTIPYPVFSIEERKRIADYLDANTKQMDALISEKQSLIEDLESYKKSLIYEVVTGKRKVVA